MIDTKDSKSIFLLATKNKLTFFSPEISGRLNIYDLWDLSLDSLDQLGRDIRKLIEEEQGDSLLSNKKHSNNLEDNKLRFEIIKAIITDKEQDISINQSNKEKLRHINILKGALDKKKIESTEKMSSEELERAIKELEMDIK